MMKNLVVLDCEVYPNYYLVAFKMLKNGKVVTIESRGSDTSLSEDQKKQLNTIMHKRRTFGFNSRNYDIPVILYALSGATCEQIHQMSDYIIENNSQGWQTLKKFNLFKPEGVLHFDIQEPSPGVMISLKLYGGRINSKRLQDLPIAPGTMLSESEMDEILLYCINDLDTTIDLYTEIRDQIDLRLDMSKQYKQDLLSKSDAQIAEAVIKSELQKKNPRKKLYKPTIPSSITYKYNVPEFISFQSEQLNDALDIIRSHDFELDGKGSIKLPKQLEQMKIELGCSRYQLGVGGIHSTEKSQVVIPNEDQILADRDVAAYYPRIILNLGLYPKHLGEDFLDVYRTIVETRIAAKKAKNKVVNESLKIVINGSFGKLGNKHSVLYSPNLLMAVTLTGQLSLLMLIETLEDAGINVVSANTDGFVSLMPKDKYDLYDAICFDWELRTNFDLEETLYKALYSRDVNNYLAVTDYGPKGKGIFTLGGVSKNPSASISITAVKELLAEGTPIQKTIRECSDLTQFLSVRTVNGGATWRGEYLGRVVRWIYSTDGDPIYYKKVNDLKGAVLEADGEYYRWVEPTIGNKLKERKYRKIKYQPHNKVPKSDGARPLMELGEFPVDIDYERYFEESFAILDSLGLNDFEEKKPKRKLK
jgi:hypothetical protein